MGNFEKVVVILILLVCVIVLSISLRSPEVEGATDRNGVSSAADLDKQAVSEQLADRQSVAPSVLDHSRDEKRGTLRDSLQQRSSKDDVAVNTEALEPKVNDLPDPLLNSMVRTSDGRDLALITTRGLRKTASPDFMIYTCRADDDWLSLSERFYGDAEHVQLLMDANETLEQVAETDDILVPAYELKIKTATRELAEPRVAAPVRDEEASKTTDSYEVVSGDSLSTISTKVYGTGSRWMQIYDANRDLLEDPHALKIGQVLRIP